jgi:hypothetical protein
MFLMMEKGAGGLCKERARSFYGGKGVMKGTYWTVTFILISSLY